MVAVFIGETIGNVRRWKAMLASGRPNGRLCSASAKRSAEVGNSRQYHQKMPTKISGHSQVT